MDAICMAISIIVAVLATVCHGQQTPTARIWPIEGYLSKHIVYEFQRETFDWFKWIIDEQNLSQPEEILAFLKKTDRQMEKENTRHAAYNGKYIAVRSDLRELIRWGDDSLELDKLMLDNYVILVEHIFGSLDVMSNSSPPSHDVGLFNYLRAYGSSKVRSFVNKLTNDYEQLIKSFDENTETALDDLIASQDDEKTASKDDKYLTRLANNIDLVNGQIDANKLLEASKNHRRKKGEKGLFVFETLGDFCTGLLHTFDYLLDVFNMIRLLSPESLSQVNLPDKLLKFNEYSRICRQRLDEVTGVKVRQNFEKQLQGSLSKLVKKVVRSS